MAKPNYRQQKKQREQAKKKKSEEKQQRRSKPAVPGESSPDATPPTSEK